jgi:hypothetical protein
MPPARLPSARTTKPRLRSARGAGATPSTHIATNGGGSYHVDGAPQDVEAKLRDAARGSIVELVWFTDVPAGRRVAINPKYVVALHAHAKLA